MAKTYIGIEVDNNRMRAVTVQEDDGKLKPVALVQRELGATDDPATAVADIFEEWDTAGARLAMALPAAGILARPLEFPFGDRKKIAAAIPLELGARLPVDLDGHLICSLEPHPGEKHRTFGIALPEERIADTIAPFDDRQLPLRLLGVTPFVYAGYLPEQPDDCILVIARSAEVAILLVTEGVPYSFRTVVRDPAAAAETASEVCRAVMALEKSSRMDELPILMFGPGLDGDLKNVLVAKLPFARVPDVTFEDEKIPAEYLSAFALARLAAKPGKSLNLRRGKYAYRSNLAPFKKQLIAAAVFLTLTLAAFVGGAWLSYTQKSSILGTLDKQMAEIYRQTFPQAGKLPKDIPLHMASRLNDARSQNKLLGGPGISPLETLAAISRAFPENSTTEIKEFSYDEKGIRLAGQAVSFDTVDQITAALNREPFFTAARISDAKTSIDGKRVNFRIEFGIAGKEGQP